MDSSDSACLVCHEAIEFYAIGKCDHPICFKCSTRMRALCDQFYCPICRTDLPEVFFLRSPEKFEDIPLRKFIPNKKLKIQFENEGIRERFETLLEHRCKQCKDRSAERNFRALRDHMRKVHTLFYCDLCLELKIFPSERKVYNRVDLAQHRRVGDKDDTSYKGHPLCQFCEERYLDKDELYKHLRKDHFFCHFCESLGSQEFYDDYGTLRDHFLTDHFLCEEGECATSQFTNAFRSSIDLQYHKATQHSRAQTKAQARQERTLNIDINLAPRPSSRPARGQGRDDTEGRRGGGGRTGGRAGAGGNKSGRYENPTPRERMDIDRAIQASLSTISEEDMKKEKKDKQPPKPEPATEEVYAQNDENFPSLAASRSVVSSAPSTTGTTTGSTNADSKSSLADRCAMAFNRSVQHGGLDDFPSLSDSVPKPVPLKHPIPAPTSVSSARPASNASSKDSTTRPGSNAPSKHPSSMPSKGAGPSKSGKSATFRNKNVEDDFPELPTSTKSSSTSSSASWNKLTVTSAPSQEPQSKSKQKSKGHDNSFSNKKFNVENDFPTLGAPKNAAVNDKWFGKSKAPSERSKKSVKESWSSENVENNNIDIRDRFSPITVPDSPKSDKTKNKKKKKKDKVSEMKEEQPQLKNNSSLDDIANLLMGANVSGDKPQELATESTKQSSKKNKRKEDKIEKKLENKKMVEPVQEPNVENSPIPVLEPQTVESEVPVCMEVPAYENYPQYPVTFQVAEDDFPSLDAACPPKNPPPGFKGKNGVSSKMPPGLSKPTKSSGPPPGMAPRSTASVNTVDFVSPVESAPLIPQATSFTYSQPENFVERNKVLIATIQSLCTLQQFTDFKTLSGEFRRADIGAQSYYNRCEQVLGQINFSQIFPELIALLPDIPKQQELLVVHQTAERKSKASGKYKDNQEIWTATPEIQSCQTCGQVILRRDLNVHLTGHNLDSDFPSLMSGSSADNTKLSQNTWVRAK